MTETAAERLSRLLSLVPWLAQHSGVSISEAAQHFGVSPSDLERDLWLIVCCGLPGHGPDQLIDIQFWDDDGRIDVIDPQSLERPLRLSAAEATALLVGLRMLAQVPGSHDRGAIASATAKLELATSAEVVASEAVILVESTPSSVRDAVDEALNSRRALRIVYAGATKDAISERLVDPRAVIHQDGFDYLDAWCRSAGAQRTFRLDRVVTAEVSDEPAAPPAQPAQPVTAPSGGVLVRLAFTPSAAPVVESLAVRHVSVDPQGGGEAELHVADPAWVVRLVLGQGGDLVVLEPPELRARVRGAAREALESH